MAGAGIIFDAVDPSCPVEDLMTEIGWCYKASNLRLEILNKCNFFWLRDIRDVDIHQCCAKCFIGGKDNRVYYGTLHKSQAVVDIDVIQNPDAKAYYLCGLSEGFVRELNTHVAFVPQEGSEINIENDRIRLKIPKASLQSTNALAEIGFSPIMLNNQAKCNVMEKYTSAVFYNPNIFADDNRLIRRRKVKRHSQNRRYIAMQLKFPTVI